MVIIPVSFASTARPIAEDKITTTLVVERNSGPARFEASHAVPPQPAGVVGERYVTELRARIAALGNEAAE
eukprot:COSAG02_NODE_22435_length_753_cov_0.522936_1_plen_70_part_10